MHAISRPVFYEKLESRLEKGKKVKFFEIPAFWEKAGIIFANFKILGQVRAAVQLSWWPRSQAVWKII